LNEVKGAVQKGQGKRPKGEAKAEKLRKTKKLVVIEPPVF
jgi:hypothetical protein